MATLQKCKLLSTHCAAAADSPTRSPVVHLRRRKTLRMLLSRSSSDRRGDRSPEIRKTARNFPDSGDSTKRKEKSRTRRKLRELFVSSPPPFEKRDTEELLPAASGSGVGDGRDGFSARRISSNGSLGPVSGAFRYRLLLRKAWRPVLVTIPEH